MSTWINGHCIDASGSLSMGCVEEWRLPHDLTSDEAASINEAINEWESADSVGYDDAAARRLDERVAEILSHREDA